MTEKQKRLITAEDLYRFQLASSARISPDGSLIVYALHRIDDKTEKKYANLWVVPADGSAPARQFTYGDQRDTQPRWSPDGRRIAFLSSRGDKDKPGQVYVIPAFGGEARPLTNLPGSIQSLAWSPDGTRLVLCARKTDEEVVEREKDEQKKKLGTVFRQYNRLFYKLDGEGYLPKERWHIWVTDAESGESKQITDHPIYDETMPAWSPDGKSIVFVSNRNEDPDQNINQEDLWVIAADGGEIRKLETPAGTKYHPAWSPDGSRIAYFGREGEDLDYVNTSVWVMPAEGGGAVNLTAKHDLHAGGLTINDLSEAEVMPPMWSADGKTLTFQVSLHGAAPLMEIGADGEGLKTGPGEDGVVIGFSRDQSGSRLAYALGTMDDPVQIWVQDGSSGARRKLTKINRDLLDEVDLGAVEEVWFQGPDQNDLQGWIMTPPGFDPAEQYPAIIEIHGGPLTQYGKFFMHEFQFLAAAGYVVAFCNPRGGRGYGEAHAGAIWEDWGNKDYADVMAWADYVEKLPYIDRARIGVTGGSYGGYMTVWIIGHTDRFKAAVTQRCVSNFVSMWGSSDFNWWFQKELRDKPPFEDLQYYWDHSPIAYIGAAKTPTMVIHNEMDHRCPIEQGEQVFVALKRLGVETEFIRFPEEFHGLSRNGRTDRRIARLGHIRRWFDMHISR